MKILMVNTPHSPNMHGGDLVQMRSTAAALREFGCEVVESFDARPDAHGFDLAHVFNLRTIPATEPQVDALRSHGMPVVISPIYLDVSYALWGTRALAHIFNTPQSAANLDRSLDQLRRHEFVVPQANGTTYSAHGANRPYEAYDERQRKILAQVSHVVPNSYLEMAAMTRTLGVAMPFTVASYGVDPGRFLDPDPAPFVRKYGLRDFILQVGRLEPAKNQVLTCRALAREDIPLVLIGQPTNPLYVDLCRRLGPKHLQIIPHLPPQELASAYAAARVHVLPSWVETCGLVTMEAALADCSIVVSTAGYEVEYYQNLAEYCAPADVGSIRSAVLRAYEGFSLHAARRRALREVILERCTWQRSAEACLSVYREVLRDRPDVLTPTSTPACSGSN